MIRRNNNNNGKHIKNHMEFSKVLLVQESILIWINTLVMLVLAFMCIYQGYFGELPWLSVMAGLPWAAYAISQREYYIKASKENTKDGIKFETVMADYKEITDPIHFNDSALG